MKQTLLLLFISIFFSKNLYSVAFKVSPVYFNKRIDNNDGYQEFTYTNVGEYPKRYKIEVVPNKGQIEGMEKWVEIYPKILTVPAKSESTVKILIKAPKGVPEGDYSFVLIPKPLKLPILGEKNGEISLAPSVEVAVNLEFKGFVGELGNPSEKIKLLKAIKNKDSNGKIKLEISLKNELQREIPLRIEATSKSGKTKIYNLIGRASPGETLNKNIDITKYKNIDEINIIKVYDAAYNKVILEDIIK